MRERIEYGLAHNDGRANPECRPCRHSDENPNCVHTLLLPANELNNAKTDGYPASDVDQ